jgi:titin
VSISWTDNSTNEDGFRVERSTDGGANWALASTTRFSGFFDEGRISEQQVCYRVTAFNTLGTSAASNTVCTVPPKGPSSLTIRSVDQQTFEFLWPDESAFEDGYEVWYESNWEPGAWYMWTQVPANSTSYTDTQLTVWCMTQAVCNFSVAATKDGGYSDFAPVATLP